MAEFGIKAPFTAAKIEARVEKTTVQIGNLTAAFAGDHQDMLSAFGFVQASAEQLKIAEAV